MSKISIKTDFVDGEKLFSQQLNNNFLVIQAGVNANEENLQQVIDQAIIELDAELEAITADRGWDWNGGDRVTFFKGTTSQVNTQEIKNGQMLYNTETGETALDDSGSRIVTGSGNVVTVAAEAPTNPATKEWIKPTTVNGVATAEEYFRNSNNDWVKILTEPSGDTLPIGAIAEFGGSVAPTNWLFCNGQAVSRTEYAELFAAIGTNYGEGDGSTTFNVPDFIGRVPVGLDAEDNDFDELGDFGGNKTAYTFLRPGINQYHVVEGTGGYGNRIITANTSLTPDQTSEVHDPVSSLQPYLVTNFIIKAKQSVGIVGTVTTNINDTNVNAVPNAGTVKASVDEKIATIGKLLWAGNFATGSITVPGISNYTLIAIKVGEVLCLGNQSFGGCVFTRYGNLDTTSYGYRYTYDATNETLTVDSLNTGATDGTNRQTITEIYGIF